MLDFSLRCILFSGPELEDLHRFHQVFCVSFRKCGTMKMLRHWFFELNPSIMSVLFPRRELEDFYKFYQVFINFALDLSHKKGVDRLVLEIEPLLFGATSS